MTRNKPPRRKPKRTLPAGFVRDYNNKPVKWDKSMIFRAMFLANEGLTERAIAVALNVHKETIYYWRRTKPEFAEALLKGKLQYAHKVEQAEIELATGYSHPAIHFTSYEGTVIQTPYIKHYPPDQKAIEFYLTNRAPNRWANVHKVDQNVNINLAHIQHIDLNAEFTIEELKMLESIGLKQIAQHAGSDGSDS